MVFNLLLMYYFIDSYTVFNFICFRIGKCVRFWTDPFDNAIYSLGTDYNYTIMSGSGVHSRVILWDKRLTTHVHVSVCFFVQ